MASQTVDDAPNGSSLNEQREKERLYEAQRTRNALLSEAAPNNATGAHEGSCTNSHEAWRLLQAAMRAPPVLCCRRKTSSLARPVGALEASFRHEITLATSPFPQRRATIRLTPFDRPWDGHRDAAEHPMATQRTVQPTPAADPAGDEVRYVVPEPLPHRHSTCTTAVNASPLERRAEACKVLTLEKDRNGPYGRPLTFIMSDDAVPFTAVLTTLQGAGFTLVTGRAALLHKTWSLYWLKRPLKSDFLAASVVKYQKVNHFPGTWRIGKKDALHQQLCTARVRWEAYEAQKDAPPARAWEADLFPEGWIIPDDLAACTAAVRAPHHSGALFIVKPAASACGRGMRLLRGGSQAVVPLSVTSEDVPLHTRARLAQSTTRTTCPPQQCVKRGDGDTKTHDRLLIQRYVADPFLVHGYKFDLRLYVVVTSYEPCRFYLYKEGLVRFATTPYRKASSSTAAKGSTAQETNDEIAPIDDLTAHLTNFTVNKKSEDFVVPQDKDPNDAAQDATAEATASKWCLSALEAHVRSLTYADGTSPRYDWDATMAGIHDVLCKTFLSVAQNVRQELRDLARGQASGPAADSSHEAIDAAAPLSFRGISPFFEMYGVDVLLRDSASRSPHASTDTASSQPRPPQPLRPVLMEVNIMPSLSTHYSPLDQCVKGNFVADALTLVGLTSMAFKAPTERKQDVPRKASVLAQQDDASSSLSPSLHAPTSFLAALSSDTAQEVCMTADEEALRAPNFHRLMPSATSAAAYAPLLSSLPSSQVNVPLAMWPEGVPLAEEGPKGGEQSGGTGQLRGEKGVSTLDQLLSAYEAAKQV